jgi:hypothetical protein
MRPRHDYMDEFLHRAKSVLREPGDRGKGLADQRLTVRATRLALIRFEELPHWPLAATAPFWSRQAWSAISRTQIEETHRRTESPHQRHCVAPAMTE